MNSPTELRSLRRPFLLLMLLGLVAIPQQAFANAGTPLMWAGLLHLVVGNLLIGVVEALLLRWWFGVPYAKAIWVMIAANYVSAWVGGLLIRSAIVNSVPMDLNNGWIWFWAMVLITFVLTLLLERPFVAWLFREAQGRRKRIVSALFAVQTTSYVLLFGWYWMASGTSLYTAMHVVAPTDLSLPASVSVYYISSSDGDVYRRSLDGSGEQRLLELDARDRNDRLFIRPSAPDGGGWDLMARLKSQDPNQPRLEVVRTNLRGEAAPDKTPQKENEYHPTSFSFGEVRAIGSATNSPWKFFTGFWAIEGVRATRKDTGERVHFSYETPFAAWTVRNAVHLPTDKLLFQLGHDQICVFDPARRKVALLWHGRGPVAVIEKGEPDQTAKEGDASPSIPRRSHRPLFLSQGRHALLQRLCLRRQAAGDGDSVRR